LLFLFEGKIPQYSNIKDDAKDYNGFKKITESLKSPSAHIPY